MTPDPAIVLAAANRRAQSAFHEMLVHRTFSDPADPRTLAYLVAERLVDDLIEAVQRGAAAEADAGNHYAGMPR